MKIVGLIQARMGSKRLPGKVIEDIHGETLVGYVIDRVAKCRQLDTFALCVPENEPGWSGCYHGVPYVCRGPEEDVTARLLKAALDLGADYFVRICGDSPLIDPDEIDRVARYPGPFVDNLRGGIPHGTCAQKYKVSALRAFYDWMGANEREHVNPTEAKWKRIMAPPTKYQLTVDTQDDLEFIRAVIGQMDRAHWTYNWSACQRIADALSS